jgi:hypothetical protein
MISIASTTSTGPNLYPHTRYHRGFPAPMPTDTIVSMAASVDEQAGPFDLGVEDLETISASLLLAWRPLSDVVLAQTEVIAEAYRHDMGLVPWQPGRRGIVNQAVCSIARLAAGELPIEQRKVAVYRWLQGMPVPHDDWQPEPVIAMSCRHVTYVRGPLWRGWEYTPVAVNHLGQYGAHPGAAVRWGWFRPRIKLTDLPERMIRKLLDCSHFSC